MEIITCDQFKMTEELHREVESKIAQVKKHLKGPVLFRLNFHRKGQSKFTVEINMLYKSVNFRSEAQGYKFSKALNECKLRLIRQVNDAQKKKMARRHKKFVIAAVEDLNQEAS